MLVKVNDHLGDVFDVFELPRDGLKLVEIAPCVDLERDILDLMETRPVIDELREMDPRIFRDEEMGLRTDLLHLDLADRIAVDATTGRLFLNFEKMRVRSKDEVQRVGQLVTEICTPLTKPVDVIVNYDGFRIDETVEAEWARLVSDLTERFYRDVSRYSGSAFMRMKLREVFPEARTHICESHDQARSFLDARRTEK